MSSKKQGRGHRLAVAALLVALLAVTVLLVTLWREPVLGLFFDRARLEESVRHLGSAGPVAIIALQVAQVLLSPIPGHVVALAGGYLYGPWLGTLYSMIGLMLGTMATVWLVRRWGRPLVERLVDPTTLARVDRFSARRGAPVLFATFLVPFLPDDIILLVAALGEVPVPGILFASFFGRLPSVFVSTWLGHGASELTPMQWAAAAAITILIAAPLYCLRASLERLMWSLLERIAGRRRASPG